MPRHILRLTALLLSLVISLPNSAWALRPKETKEDPSRKSGLEAAMRSPQLAAGAEQGPKGEPLPDLQARLQRPQVTSATGIRARVLTGEGKTYDAIVRDQFPVEMVPSLKDGLSALLAQLNADGPFSWIDGAGGLGAALREGRNLYPNLQPVLVDAVRWTRDQFTPEVLQELESQAAARGIDLWSPEGGTFIQEDLSRVDLSSLGGPPAKLFTMLNALAYNKDPLGLLVNIYNQLPEGALLLTNLYLPTGHPKAEELARFHEALFRRLEKEGIADLRVADLRQMDGITLTHQRERGPFDEFTLGIVLRKGPGRLRLNVQPQSEPFLVIPRPGSDGREVEYEVASYGEDPSRVLTYEIAAGAEGISPERVAEAVEQFRAEWDPAKVQDPNLLYYLEGEGTAFAPVLALLEAGKQPGPFSFAGVVETRQDYERLAAVLEANPNAQKLLPARILIIEEQPAADRQQRYDIALKKLSAITSGMNIRRVTTLEPDLLAQLNRILAGFGYRLPEDATVREAALILLQAA